MIIVDISVLITYVALDLGGAIFMIPLFLSVPPLPGVGQFDMKPAAAISMAQVLYYRGHGPQDVESETDWPMIRNS